MPLVYDVFSVLLWLVPAVLLLVWFWRRAKTADKQLRARTEANAAMFMAQVQAQMKPAPTSQDTVLD